jgi:hypothetical protein
MEFCPPGSQENLELLEAGRPTYPEKRDRRLARENSSDVGRSGQRGKGDRLSFQVGTGLLDGHVSGNKVWIEFHPETAGTDHGFELDGELTSNGAKGVSSGTGIEGQLPERTPDVDVGGPVEVVVGQGRRRGAEDHPAAVRRDPRRVAVGVRKRAVGVG